MPIPARPAALAAKQVFLAAILLGYLGCGNGSADTIVTRPPSGTPEQLVTETLATGFSTIWELAWGPDASIWVSERGGTITRVNPATGAKSVVGQLAVHENGEGGLMGIAFHPDFSAQPYVFAMHTYNGAGGVRNRLVRMRFNGTTLAAPETLLEDIPGSTNHNGARIAVGPDRLLYVSTGDAANEALSQDRTYLAGKILRLTLNGAPAPGNPFGTAIYSYGHRNPQGLVFHPTTGALYSTEHGPGDNDEVNRIEAGRNYGWPNVRGRCDGDAGPGEQAFCLANNVAEPLATWSPTIAPAGADVYVGTAIPGWQGSLLFTSLRNETLYRLTLSADGRRVVSADSLFKRSFGRLRDVLAAPNGLVYLGTSNRDGRGSPRAGDDRIVRVRAQ